MRKLNSQSKQARQFVVDHHKLNEHKGRTNSRVLLIELHNGRICGWMNHWQGGKGNNTNYRGQLENPRKRYSSRKIRSFSLVDPLTLFRILFRVRERERERTRSVRQSTTSLVEGSKKEYMPLTLNHWEAGLFKMMRRWNLDTWRLSVHSDPGEDGQRINTSPRFKVTNCNLVKKSW